MKKTILAWIALGACAALGAQSPSPTHFLGFELGQPLPASMECPESSYGKNLPKTYNPYQTKNPCWMPEPDFVELVELHNVIPENPTRYAIGDVKDGNLTGITLRFNSSMDEDMLDALTSRFGKPTSEADEDVANGLGAHWKRHSAAWTTSSMHVEFESTTDKYNEGLISANTSTAFAELHQKEQERKDALKQALY